MIDYVLNTLSVFQVYNLHKISEYKYVSGADVAMYPATSVKESQTYIRTSDTYEIKRRDLQLHASPRALKTRNIEVTKSSG